MPRIASIEQRFVEKFKINEATGCWEWTGHIASDGYGIFWPDGTRSEKMRVRAHRFSYERSRGPIPAGLFVCHRCDNRKCLNPDHLFLGTDADNSADKVKEGRQAYGTKIPQAKLTEKEVIAIRGTIGISQRALAKQYGVSCTTISDIKTGKWWKQCQ